MTDNQKGEFIVIEGLDGSGKSSQLALLEKQLVAQGEPVYITCEPSERPIGKLIRDVLEKRLVVTPDTLAAMFLADRLDHIQNDENGILKHLKEGVHVISDRYYWSSYAYHSLDVDIKWVIELNRAASKILRPDITIFLDLPADISYERITANRESKDLFEKKELLQRVRDNYHHAFKLLRKEEKYAILDADKTINKLAEEIWYTIEPILYD